DLPLALEFGSCERRLLQDVGNEAKRDALVAFENPGEVGRRLEARRGVELTAHLLDLLGDLLGRALLRALERHMLQEMRAAVLTLAFLARAGAYPHPQRDRLELRHGLGDETQTVRQRSDRRGHAAPSLVAWVTSSMSRSAAARSLSMTVKRSCAVSSPDR